MSLPFLDLRAGYLELKPEIDDAVSRVFDSGQYILGAEVQAFEHEWAKFCDARFSVGVANGLDALELALMALGVGPGDEVLVPSNTYIATWLAVSNVGAIPVPVEPEEDSYNIDVNLIEEAITRRTTAIVPVHLYGQPADLDPILEIAKRHKLWVVEDAAQAHGARYRGRRIGGHSHVVAWSFYPGKNLGAFGDAGAITTDSEVIADRIRVLRNYGSRVKYLNESQGVNSRMDPIQAAALRVKLKYLDEWNARRAKIADRYLDLSKKLAQAIEVQSELEGRLSNRAASPSLQLRFPEVLSGTDPVWHLFVVRSRGRDSLVGRLAERNIETLIHYPTPPNRQNAYKELAVASQPIAELLSSEVFSLPIGPQMKLSDSERVFRALAQGVKADSKLVE